MHKKIGAILGVSHSVARHGTTRLHSSCKRGLRSQQLTRSSSLAGDADPEHGRLQVHQDPSPVDAHPAGQLNWSRLERFFRKEENSFALITHQATNSWRCRFLQLRRQRCSRLERL
jgi:hypothetical protein